MSTDDQPPLAPKSHSLSSFGNANHDDNDDVDLDDTTAACCDGDAHVMLSAADQAMTCDALCSLGNHTPAETFLSERDKICSSSDAAAAASKRKSSLDSLSAAAIISKGGGGCCAKQLQLPMFLTKTYHMIEKCDPKIVTWSESGDSFVVKSLDKFSKDVLPLYFKHNNFSSFARQLNFYGFRKLRSDPILTTDVDPSTACFIRFYHEHFQRGRPELLQHIKRATKAEQHAKDDVETLRMEICTLKEQLRTTVSDFDRKLAELSYECNRRITSMNAEYDKLLALVTNAVGPQAMAKAAAMPAAAPPLVAASGNVVPANASLLHSLSQAAVSLQNHAQQANMVAAATPSSSLPPPQPPSNGKRPAPSGDETKEGDSSISKVARVDV